MKLLPFVVLVWFTTTACTQHLPVPALRYDYADLEPIVDEATMRVHHLGHLTAYTNKLNSALADLRADAALKKFAKMGIDRLLLSDNLEALPEEYRDKVRNNGGGYVNHELFFNSMAKPQSKGGHGGGSPSGALEKVLASTFGSVEQFKEHFSAAANTLFGSGYAWLLYDHSNYSVYVSTTVNQESPISDSQTSVLLTIDVWEHAYYLKHQNRRKDWVAAFWDVVDWREVEDRYAKAERKYRKEL